jgi:hypothetical protein
LIIDGVFGNVNSHFSKQQTLFSPVLALHESMAQAKPKYPEKKKSVTGVTKPGRLQRLELK